VPIMQPKCPQCEPRGKASELRTTVNFGRYYRKSDGRWIRRFRCLKCAKGFSRATGHPCYRQNKRQKNIQLFRLLCSGVSQRRAAELLKINRTTVVRKFRFLAQQARGALQEMNKKLAAAAIVEFDDMETHEHSKCKPLSITLAIEGKSRRILGFQVSQMPAKGLLASISRKKYGRRLDGRPNARRLLFEELKPLIQPGALIKSDENPHYPIDVRRHFPGCSHERHKGKRGCIAGQGELKKIGFDPLFSLNHTCAKLRANINRLFRRTWCTTKKAERLSDHIALYALFHNQKLAA
jgi:transposase-like protein